MKNTFAINSNGYSREYLPPYSPDFNLMELAFAKLMVHLLQAPARTLDELQSAVATP